MKRGWMALVALVLVASAVPLLQVAYDRSAPPRLTLRLTHREFILSWSGADRTGEMLSWSWGSYPALDSLTAEQLGGIGLRCDNATWSCGSRAGRGRRGFVVVTLDTLPWRRQLDRLQRRIDSLDALLPQDSSLAPTIRETRDAYARARDYESRLRAVDAGRDPEALAAKWDDGRHLILPARLRVTWQNYASDTTPPARRLFHVTADPEPGLLYVPKQWSALVRDTATTYGRYDDRAKFDITIAVGRGWLPRVLEVTR